LKGLELAYIKAAVALPQSKGFASGLPKMQLCMSFWLSQLLVRLAKANPWKTKVLKGLKKSIAKQGLSPLLGLVPQSAFRDRN
jgi:hypothetical protein